MLESKCDEICTSVDTSSFCPRTGNVKGDRKRVRIRDRIGSGNRDERLLLRRYTHFVQTWPSLILLLSTHRTAPKHANKMFATHRHINTSTHQHINTSTHQHTNTSTHRHINTSTHQHINIDTPTDHIKTEPHRIDTSTHRTALQTRVSADRNTSTHRHIVSTHRMNKSTHRTAL
jgi:hypothetical protein